MPRLVDADALKTELMLAAETLTVAYEAHGEGHVAHFEDIIKCDKMNELLRNFPAIDAVPVKRGKWIMDSTFPNGIVMCHCSECEYLKTIFSDEPQIYWNYCPNCGADMRGKDYGIDG